MVEQKIFCNKCNAICINMPCHACGNHADYRIYAFGSTTDRTVQTSYSVNLEEKLKQTEARLSKLADEHAETVEKIADHIQTQNQDNNHGRGRMKKLWCRIFGHKIGILTTPMGGAMYGCVRCFSHLGCKHDMKLFSGRSTGYLVFKCRKCDYYETNSGRDSTC